MRDNCDIVKDLLPLYVEDLTSESSNQFIEKHIATCDECLAYLKNIRKEMPIIEESLSSRDHDDQALVNNIKKRMGSRIFIAATVGIFGGLLLSANIFPWASIALVAFLIFIGMIIYLMY